MIAIITEDQKQILSSKYVNENQPFNPVKDVDNNWVISEEEITQCNDESIQWIKLLPLIEYVGVPSIGEFDTINYDKENGLALAAIKYYNDKLYLFRFNKTSKKVLISELDNEGLTHLNNTLSILNPSDYIYIEYQRGMNYFYICKSNGNNIYINIDTLTNEQKITLHNAGIYFMNLTNN